MSTIGIDESDLITSAVLEEKAKLKRHFSRFDIFFFLICTIVGVDTLAQVAINGAQGFPVVDLPVRLLLHPLRPLGR